MKDLSEISGLPIKLDGWRIVPGQGIRLSEPAVRRADDMRDVFMEQKAPVKPPDLYFMYRGAYMDADARYLEASGLRYDLTVIRPGLLGSEYMKTAGHYHPVEPESGVGYPEVYEVLSGTARYLLQKLTNLDPEDGVYVVEDIILVEAIPGDKVVIPPDYGHITINPGTEPLVMANWISRSFSSIYKPIVETCGGAYYLVNAQSGYHLVANNRYSSLKEPRFLDSMPVPELGLMPDKPMYISWAENPDRFKWLNKPGGFLDFVWKAFK